MPPLIAVSLGTQWFVDAHQCRPASLRSRDILAEVFSALVAELALNPVGDATWRVFPGEGGVTGLLLLEESHLACHTFPERGFAAFDLYCCRPRDEWPWAQRLADHLGAQRVIVRSLHRGRD
jgi:S-adenosylmethionine decarboxylase